MASQLVDCLLWQLFAVNTKLIISRGHEYTVWYNNYGAKSNKQKVYRVSLPTYKMCVSVKAKSLHKKFAQKVGCQLSRFP
jgi:hypothetical protein